MGSAIVWLAGPGKAAELLLQLQAVQKVGHQLDCEEGVGGVVIVFQSITFFPSVFPGSSVSPSQLP